MMHGVIIGIDPGSVDETVIALLKSKGVQVIIHHHEPQTTTTEDFARRMLDVQAKQIRKGPGKEARTPWFRQFEKRGRYGRGS